MGGQWSGRTGRARVEKVRPERQARAEAGQKASSRPGCSEKNESDRARTCLTALYPNSAIY